MIDVSGDDCTDSELVYDRPPAQSTLDDPGIPFINDGCYGDRIFLGINGEQRELKRAENVRLGTGGAYSDGEYRVLVKTGSPAWRGRGRSGDDREFCHHEPGAWEYDVISEAEVRIWSGDRSWRVDGALHTVECGPGPASPR